MYQLSLTGRMLHGSCRLAFRAGWWSAAVSWWMEAFRQSQRPEGRLHLLSAGVKASWLPVPEQVEPQGGYLIPATPEGIRFVQLIREGVDRAAVIRSEWARAMALNLDREFVRAAEDEQEHEQAS